MAMKPYPSNLVTFYIDERVLDEELKLDINRSWTHLGGILVRPREAAQGEGPRNVVHVMVKFGTRRYLAVDGGESDANWSERIEHHLLATMRNVSSNAVAFNRRRRNAGLPALALDAIQFELEGGRLTLEFALDSNGAVPTDCAAVASAVRDALGTGVLGDPVLVRVPSRRSYEEQVCLARQAKEEALAREAQERAERLAEEQEARREAEKVADEQFMESPELVAEVAEEERSHKADSPLELTPLSDEEWEALYGAPDPDFAVDYRLWEPVYGDGTSREFDSQTGAFIE